MPVLIGFLEKVFQKSVFNIFFPMTKKLSSHSSQFLMNDAFLKNYPLKALKAKDMKHVAAWHQTSSNLGSSS